MSKEGDLALFPMHHPCQRDGGEGFSDENVSLDTRFEGGNGYHLRKIAPGRYAIDIEPEPGIHDFSGWGYFFCFAIQNRAQQAQKIRVELNSSGNEDFLPLLARGTGHVISNRGGEIVFLKQGSFGPLEGEKGIWLDLELPPSSQMLQPWMISNFHTHSLTQLEHFLDGAKQDPGVRLSRVCQTEQGRDMPLIELGREDASAPCVVISQTPQPSEMLGTWSCRAVVDYLTSHDELAQKILSENRVCILPCTNPDGTMAGLGVSHPGGNFPYFEGHLAADGDPKALPESIAQWKFLEENKPWAFIEWHSNNWSRRPGHMLLKYRPALLKNPERRAHMERWLERLDGLSDTYHGSWTSWDEGMYRVCMGFHAMTRLDCISIMIKHHDRFPRETSAAQAVESFRQLFLTQNQGE